MSVPTDPNSALSSLCLSTATAGSADQAGRSGHRLSLERILKNQEHKRHPNELCVIAVVTYHTYHTLASAE
jgi:hypothetical protein